MSFIVIIPARYKSTRLKNKLLLDINGKSIIQRTYENAKQSLAKEIIIATDNKIIIDACNIFGAKTCLTSSKHISGSSRITEVITKYNINDDEIIVNLQADEPMLSAKLINQVANNLNSKDYNVATLCENISDKKQYYDSNCVKVVRDKFNNALYFSRANIPYFRDDSINLALCYKHIGIYAYRAKFLVKYINKTKTSYYERAELLEQLSILYAGHKIHTDTAITSSGIGIDTKQDLDNVRKILKNN